MKIEQKQASFHPVHITIESVEELFVFFSAFGSASASYVNESADRKVKSNVIKTNVKNMVKARYSGGEEMLWKVYNEFGALLEEQGVFCADCDTDFKGNLNSVKET